MSDGYTRSGLPVAVVAGEGEGGGEVEEMVTLTVEPEDAERILTALNVAGAFTGLWERFYEPLYEVVKRQLSEQGIEGPWNDDPKSDADVVTEVV